MRRPAQGATGGWVMLGLVSSGFICVSSHYLILPKVSCLVVYGLGVSSPTPKAEDLSDCVRAAITGHVQGELVLRHDERWQLQQ